jgi:RHS repeat-associated protein
VCGADQYGQSGSGLSSERNKAVQVPLTSVKTLAAGAGFSLSALGDGTVWNFGYNLNGDLGVGSTLQYAAPQQASQLADLTALSAGRGDEAMALDSSGTVWAWGLGGAGMLGNGTTDSSLVPMPSNMADATAISCAFEHDLALKNDGTVWAWGDNSSGQLGNGTTTSSANPVQVTGLTNIAAISAGYCYSVALDKNGAVWTWGANAAGTLGNGTTAASPTAVQITGLPTIVAISAGDFHVLALDSSGNVWSWGTNTAGQLGNGSTTEENSPVELTGVTGVKAISAGSVHSLALTTGGMVWSWGDNTYGELGDGTFAGRTSPVQALALNGITAITAGENHSLALKEDGTVEAFGDDSFAELGIGYDYSAPFLIPGLNLLAATSPSVSITAPANNATVTLGQSQTFTVSASETGGSVAAVLYYLDAQLIGEQTTAPFSLSWAPSTYGNYTITAVAIDENGITSARSTPVTVQVPYDSDGNGLSDWWEIKYFGHLDNNPASSLNGNGLTLLQDYQQGVSPVTSNIPVITSALAVTSGAGASISYTIAATQSPASFSAADLPGGLSLNSSTGVISGTPTEAGVFTVLLGATNSTGTGTANLILTIGSAFTSPTTATGTIGQAFNYVPALSVPAVVSYAETGALPPGLGFDTTTGVIYGTPTTTGSYPIMIATTAAGATTSSSVTLTIDSGQVGQPYQSSATAPVLFAESGSLPPGLSFNANTGVLSGTPTTLGAYPVTISTSTASGSASLSLTITIDGAFPIITSSTSVSGAIGTPLNYAITTTGIAGSYSATNLPPGLHLDSVTGVISGTPDSPGAFTTQLGATNDQGTGTLDVTFTITGSSPPVITSAGVLYVTQGASFSYQVTAVNSPTSYAATMTGGLPSTVSFNTSTGVLSGTFDDVGTPNITLGATNSLGTGSMLLIVAVGSSGTPLTENVSLQSGVSPFTGYTTTSMTLKGPDTSGTAYESFSGLSAGAETNSVADRAMLGFDLSVLPPGSTINSASLALYSEATTNGTLTYALELHQADGPFEPAVSDWMTSNGYASTILSQITCSDSATPATEAFSTGTDFVSAVQTAYGNGAPLYLMLVSPTAEGSTDSPLPNFSFASESAAVTSERPDLTLNITTDSPPLLRHAMVYATSGTAYSDTLHAVTASSYTMSVTPAMSSASNWALNSTTGVVTGTPQTSDIGSHTVTISATNGNGTGTTTYTLDVGQPPSITSSGSASGSSGTAFSYTITGTNSPTTFAARGLPAGLTLDSTTGVISGTPTSGGNDYVTVSATNPYGTTSSSVTINVTPAAPLLAPLAPVTGNAGMRFADPLIGFVLNDPNSTDIYSAAGLPSSLSMRVNTIFGTPSTSDIGIHTVNITAKDATGETSATETLQITILPAPAADVPSTTIYGVEGQALSVYLPQNPIASAYGSMTDLNLYSNTYSTADDWGGPAGATVEWDGTIDGTPTASGTFNATAAVSVVDEYENVVATGTANINFDISATPPGLVLPTLLFPAVVGGSFNYSFQTINGNTATFTVTGLPAGLQYVAVPGDQTQGTIVGTPTAATPIGSPAVITIQAQDTTNPSNITTQTLSLPVAPALTGTSGVPFNTNPLTNDGFTTFSLGSGPSWLSIDPTTGVLSGTPSAAGLYFVDVSATDSATYMYSTESYQLTVLPDPSNPTIDLQEGVSPQASYTVPATSIGTDTSNSNEATQPLAASNTISVGKMSTTETRRGLLSFDLSSIPAGATITSATLVLSPASGAAAGVPMDVDVYEAGSSFDSATADWSTDSPVQSTELAALTLNPASLPGTVTMTGFPEFAAAVQNDLLVGRINLTLLSYGAESQTSPVADYIGFTGHGTPAAQNPELILTYSLANTAPSIASPTVAWGTEGQPMSYTIMGLASGLTYSATGLPAGLAVHSTTGVISGTPTAVGSSVVVVGASNTYGSASQSVTFNVDSATPAASLSMGGGNNQSAVAGTYTSMPLTVNATQSGGGADAGCLVTFTCAPGDGFVATAKDGSATPVSTLSIPTNSGGSASAYLLMPQNIKPVTVTVSAGTATPLVFNATSVASLSTAAPSQNDVPVLSILSGGGQAGPSGTTLPNAIVVQALNHEGLPWTSLPISVGIVSGGGTLSTTGASGFGSGPLSLSTGSNGQVTFYLRPGTGPANVVSCTASTGGASQTIDLVAATASASGTSPAPGGIAAIGTDTPTPIVPDGGVQVSSNSSGNTIVLSRAASLGGGNYILQESNDGGSSWSNVGTLSGTTPFPLSSLAPDTRYLFRTVTVASNGEQSAPSGITSYYTGAASGGPIAFDADGWCNTQNPDGEDPEGALNGIYYFPYYPDLYAGPGEASKFEFSGAGSKFVIYEVQLNTSSGSPVYKGVGNVAMSFTAGPDAVVTATQPMGNSTGTYFAYGGSLAASDPYGSQYDTAEKRSGAAIIPYKGSASVGIVMPTGVPYPNNYFSSKAVLTWSGNNFDVSLNGNPIVSGASVPSVGFGSTLTITPDSTRPPTNGEQFSLTALFSPDGGGSLGSDQVIYSYNFPPPDLSMPIDEASGPKYRKIALNGLPLSDDKPQQAPETDQEDEQTFVDALTMGLRHSTTDVYLPIAGSDLTLSARRDFRSEVWNDGSGLRPHEKWDEPFGACWSSNLAANIRFDSVYNPKSPTPVKAYVTDESGGVHSFYSINNTYCPIPTAKNEQTPNLESLIFDPSSSPPQYIFKRKYGTTLTFVACGSVQVAENRLLNNGTLESTSYARLIQAVDRLGNTVLYHFSGPSNIVPDTISVLNHPDLQLSIAQDSSGHITSIWDANGNKTTYQYSTASVQGDANSVEGIGYETVLTGVTTPDGKTTSYSYNFASELDQTPGSAASKPAYCYGDLASITDPLNRAYQFFYAFDHSKLNYMKNPSIFTGYYIQSGVPRDLVRIVLPDGSVTQLANQSKVYVSSNGTELAPEGQRHIQVTDASGFVRLYRFESPQIFSLTNFGASLSQTNIVAYTSLSIDNGSAANGTYYGTETFQFDPNAAMAVKEVTDLSGKSTSYAHGDAWYESSGIPSLGIAGLNGVYGDPTQETNALSGTKTFTYTAGSRIMNSMTDENGTQTVYQIDALGRRTKETILPSGSTTPIQVTDFVYGNATYPGFMTQKTVEQQGSGDPSWATGKSLTTQYLPDSNGRVAQEIIDPGNLALTTSYTYDANGNKLTTVDPRGYTTWFSYDKRNRLVTVTNPDGSQKQTAYDADSNKSGEYDENGNATFYQYDALNRLVTEARDLNGNGQIDGRSQDLVTTTTYNTLNSKLSSTSPAGGTTSYAYDGLQRVVRISDPLGQVTSFAYGMNSGGSIFSSSEFKPTQTIDPRGTETDIVYDSLYRPTSKSVHYDATGDVSTTHTGYDPVGNPLTATDPLGHVTTTAYDALNRPVRVTNADSTTRTAAYTSTGFKYQATDENGHTTQYQYDTAGRATETLQPSVYDAVSGTTKQPVTQTIYDASGDVVATINPLGNQWDYSFDACNRKIQELAPAAANGPGGTMTRAVTQWDYDPAGRVVATIDARGQETDTRYDRADRVVEVQQPAVSVNGGASSRPTTLSSYDADGNVLTVTDPNGHVTTNSYDLLNRLVTTNDAANITVKNSYDPVGNKTAVSDGLNHTTAFAYDGLNRNTKVIDPLGNATTLNYNALNKTSRVDALSQTTSYTYDVRNRLTGVSYSPTSAVNFARAYAYDNAGNLTGVTESALAAANVAYTYDALNRVSTETSNGISHEYDYDLAGNRLTTKYDTANGSTERILTSIYDELNRLGTLTEGTRVTGYAYDLNGNIVQKVLPNGDTETDTYDALNRSTAEATYASSANGGGLECGFTYGYDLDGNVTVVGESYPSGLNNRTVTNSYDPINRLVSEAVTGSAPNVTTGYAYDAANNRTEMTISGGSSPGSTTYSYNKLNQLLSFTKGTAVTSYTYDADGNRATRTQSGSTDTYAYDGENRLVSLTKNTSGGAGTYSYQYDYRTRRITRVESGVTTALVFSGGTSVREYTGTASGAPVVEYLRGPDYGGGVGGILYSLRSGTPSYTHENKRGDVVAKTSASGALTYQAQYAAFGNQTQTSGATLDRQKSNSKDTDPTNLVDEGFRYRDLETGSFITRDPSGFVDGPNEYTYVLQNPWTKYDPEGLMSASDFVPDPRPSLNQAMEGWNEAFSSEASIGQRAFGVTEGLAFDLDATVNLIPGEGYAEHTAEKVVVNEVKKEIESGVKQEVKTTVENDTKKEVEKTTAETGKTEQKVTRACFQNQKD